MENFFETLRVQRWDDHRFYHHSRINQSLHLLSACSFVCAYFLIFKHPAVAVFLAWVIGMVSRQCGHFFFEPHDFDDVNNASHHYKEEIKVGYNLYRKVVLMSIWVLSPLLLVASPTLFGFFPGAHGAEDFLNHVAVLWLVVGIGGLLFRTIHLFFLSNVQAGLAWMTKIITDPFHDISLYWEAPLHLMRGELIDPLLHVRENCPGYVSPDGEVAKDGGNEADGQPSPAGAGV